MDMRILGEEKCMNMFIDNYIFTEEIENKYFVYTVNHLEQVSTNSIYILKELYKEEKGRIIM